MEPRPASHINFLRAGIFSSDCLVCVSHIAVLLWSFYVLLAFNLGLSTMPLAFLILATVLHKILI